ncbi:protein Simiate isoform X5 [Amborella trichopoda]|uniref:protein Simiate isoform X5 n=1 Tax=Amborella trichopoda TaxID=13333 RepID=UPI0005D370B1|nr:protein Simiate isoform X5 [Amborella trichopoda]|eukprot:XP_011621055.1 protein Simiate isoform X5 [Amborella trichopoda]
MTDAAVPPPSPTLEEDSEVELRRLLLPDPNLLILSPPPSAVDSNYVHYFIADFLKPGHDQYIYRHANGLCVIGLAPTHASLSEGGVTSVDFNVGKSDRSEIKVTGKRKKNAQLLEPNSALCKVYASDNIYIARCCIKGSLLEVNNRLIKEPGLLNSSASREGYLAIIMPKPADWLKSKSILLNREEYKKLRGLS